MNWLRHGLVLTIVMGIWSGGGEAQQVDPSAQETSISEKGQAPAAQPDSFLTEEEQQLLEQQLLEMGTEYVVQRQRQLAAAEAAYADGTGYLSTVIRNRELLAEAFEQAGQIEDAETQFREAYALRADPEADFAGQDPTLVLEEFLRRHDRGDEADRLFDTRVAPIIARSRDPVLTGAAGFSWIDEPLATVASQLADRQRFAEAETLYRRAIARADLGVSLEPQNRDLKIWRAKMFAGMALTVRDQGRLEEAADLFAQANGVLRIELGPEHYPTARNREAYYDVLMQLARPEDARALYAGSDDASWPSLQRFEATGYPRTLEMVNVLYGRAERVSDEDVVPGSEVPEIVQNLRAGLAIQRSLLPASHPDIALTLFRLAEAQNRLGNFSEAEAILKELIALHADTAWMEADRSEYEYFRSDPRSLLDDVLVAQGKTAEASGFRENFFGTVAQMEAALAEAQALDGPSGPETIAATGTLAHTLFEEGRAREGEALMRSIMAAREFRLERDFVGLLLAGYLIREGRLADAEILAQAALTTARESEEMPDGVMLAMAREVLVDILIRQRRYTQAEVVQRERIARNSGRAAARPADWVASAPECDDYDVSLNAQLALILLGTGATGEAEALAVDVLSHRVEYCGEQHADTTSARAVYASLLQDRGALGEAEPLLRAAVEYGFVGVCAEPETRRAAGIAEGVGPYRWSASDPLCPGAPDFTENAARLASVWADPITSRPTAGLRLYSHASDMVLGRTRARYMSDGSARSEFDRFRNVHADLVSAAWSASEAR